MAPGDTCHVGLCVSRTFPSQGPTGLLRKTKRQETCLSVTSGDTNDTQAHVMGTCPQGTPADCGFLGTMRKAMKSEKGFLNSRGHQASWRLAKQGLPSHLKEKMSAQGFYQCPPLYQANRTLLVPPFPAHFCPFLLSLGSSNLIREGSLHIRLCLPNLIILSPEALN